MRPHRLAACVLIVFTVLGPCLAGAQEIDIEQRPRPDASGVDSPATSSPAVPGRDARVDHVPAFIEPFAGTYETPTLAGRFGLSGWTTANPPLGPPYRDVTGWSSFGFTLTWGPKPSVATP
jgi:hypothetical protein